jgi:hypothetical protein
VSEIGPKALSHRPTLIFLRRITTQILFMIIKMLHSLEGQLTGKRIAKAENCLSDLI